MKLSVTTRRLRLREPLRFAWGALEEREILEVTLDDGAGDGVVGIGEAAPLEGYDGVSVAAVRAELESGAPESPYARAAIDIAEHDLRAKRAGVPVAALLTDQARVPAGVPVNALASTPEAAARAVAAGFRCVKVKVGLGDDDVSRVRAFREAVGGDVALRVDANGAWPDVATALERLRALEPFDIEYCEEPVWGLAAMRELRFQSPVPIAVDETGSEAGPVVAAGSGAADVMVVKIGRCGGITGLLEAATVAHAHGAGVTVASAFDGPAGIRAALHAAAALKARGVALAPCGLATLSMFEDVDAPPVRPDGTIALF